MHKLKSEVKKTLGTSDIPRVLEKLKKRGQYQALLNKLKACGLSKVDGRQLDFWRCLVAVLRGE